MLTPASVVVIGADHSPGSVGRAILQNIIDGGFCGSVSAVSPGAAELDGVPCVPSAAALPDQVDLAVVAVPAPAVPGVAEDCGRRGVKALVVTAPGLDGAARAELLGICRRHGMRLVGPASFGVASLLDLHGEDEVRRGYRSLRETFGDRMTGVIVQPMITGGVEVKISVLEEQTFGPLVLFEAAGAADGLADRAARSVPLTSIDADDLIRSGRAAPLLPGRPGVPAADLGSLKNMLLRVSQMADDLPQITELDLSPVIARPDGAVAVDARVRIQPAQPPDAYLRRLR